MVNRSTVWRIILPSQCKRQSYLTNLNNLNKVVFQLQASTITSLKGEKERYKGELESLNFSKEVRNNSSNIKSFEAWKYMKY